jgi:hypothetical protein
MFSKKKKDTQDDDFAFDEWYARMESGEQVTLQQVQDEIKLVSDGWREMEPLQVDSNPSLPYPIELLPPILRDAIRDKQRIIQAPLPLIASSVIASANLAVQSYANVETIDGRVVVISLFFLTEAVSGERKSTVDFFALTAHREFDERLAKEALEHRHQLEASLVIWERRKENFKKRQDALHKSGKALSREDENAAFLEQVGPKPAQWQGVPVRIVRDSTTEGLEKHFAISTTLGLFSDEGATFLGGYSMSADNALRTVAVLCGLWDGKGVHRTRSGDGMISCSGKRLAFHLMVQPVVLNKVIASNDGLKGQGFLARCLITRAPSTIGSRPFVSERVLQAKGVVALRERISAILEMPIPIKPGTLGQLQPRVLTLTPAAQELYVDYYNQVERRQAKGGEFAEITGAASKAPEQALRLAATCELIENPDASCISTKAFEAGREMSRYYLNEALRLDQDGQRNYELDCAAQILEWIKEAGLSEFYISRLTQFGPPCARKSSDVSRKYLEILCRHGYLQAHRVSEASKQVLYKVHPKLGRRQS